MEFSKRFDDDGEPIECECCHYPGRLETFPGTMTHRGQRDLVLCEVCANTYLSIAEKYPNQCPDGQLYRSVAVLGNMLLEAIREKGK